MIYLLLLILVSCVAIVGLLVLARGLDMGEQQQADKGRTR